MLKTFQFEQSVKMISCKEIAKVVLAIYKKCREINANDITSLLNNNDNY